MARRPRIQRSEACYHVIARGIERRALFSGKRDYEHFLELLGRFCERYACNISAYVLMPNHFHLFVQTMEVNLSGAVQSTKAKGSKAKGSGLKTQNWSSPQVIKEINPG
jgi:Transposase and inactivated derivatives